MAKYSVQHQPIEIILSWIKSGEIAIPEIQRPFVWSSSQVRDLMDSLYKGYPIGYIITWKAPDIRLKDGTLSQGKRILIDGQQRITALTAAVVGQKVLDKDYKNIEIKIAYNPLANVDQPIFEVCNAAIERNPRWISSIAPILNEEITLGKTRREYLEKNKKTDEKDTEADEDFLEKQLEALKSIKNRQIGIIQLNHDLDIDTVTEIFIRINQKGVVLSNADFVMSKIASDQQFGGNKLRKMVDYFCHLLNDRSFVQKLETADHEFSSSAEYRVIKWIADKEDALYHPNYTGVLRTAYTYAFKRGKFSTLVALLSGRNFETRQNTESIAEESYRKLKKGLDAFFNQTHYERFLLLLRSAGFISKQLLNSQNSLNMAYAIYLHLAELQTSDPQIQTWVRKWLVMSILTGRYSGSAETIIEQDIQRIAEKGIAACLEQIGQTELNESFWKHNLVGKLDSSSSSNGAYLCYLAAQCKNQDKAFLSDSISISALLQERGDQHHIFPKAYLEKSGYKRSDYNQVANYAFIEQQINIRIGDKAPDIYLDLVKQDIAENKKQYTSLSNLKAFEDNLIENCIPTKWQEFNSSTYNDFLIERRKLMAEKIKSYYRGL